MILCVYGITCADTCSIGVFYINSKTAEKRTKARGHRCLFKCFIGKQEIVSSLNCAGKRGRQATSTAAPISAKNPPQRPSTSSKKRANRARETGEASRAGRVYDAVASDAGVAAIAGGADF